MSELLKFDPVKEFIELRDNLADAIAHTLKVQERDRSFPALNIYEEQNGDFVVQTQAIANLDPKSVEVLVENDVLTVSGIILDPAHTDVTYLLKEIPSGFFSRSVSLTDKVSLDDIRAHVSKSGVISIRFFQN